MKWYDIVGIVLLEIAGLNWGILGITWLLSLVNIVSEPTDLLMFIFRGNLQWIAYLLYLIVGLGFIISLFSWIRLLIKKI